MSNTSKLLDFDRVLVLRTAPFRRNKSFIRRHQGETKRIFETTLFFGRQSCLFLLKKSGLVLNHC